LIAISTAETGLMWTRFDSSETSVAAAALSLGSRVSHQSSA